MRGRKDTRDPGGLFHLFRMQLWAGAVKTKSVTYEDLMKASEDLDETERCLLVGCLLTAGVSIIGRVR